MVTEGTCSLKSKPLKSRPPRSALACKNYYEHVIDPNTKQGKMPAREVARLKKILDDDQDLSWDAVAAALNTENAKNYIGPGVCQKRTAWACFQEASQMKRKKSVLSRQWSKQEDSELLDAVQIFGENNWQDVSEYIGTRYVQYLSSKCDCM